MLDSQVRRAAARGLRAPAQWLDRRGVSANAITIAGFALGVGACVAAGSGRWYAALGLLSANRLFDALDGLVARRQHSGDEGGFLDIAADFAVYGGFVLGVAVARPDARLACAALLLAYYLNGTAFLAYSSIAERRRQAGDDDRSLQFLTGLTESTETFVAYVAFCLLPQAAETIAWVFTAAVTVTVGQRVWFAVRTLSRDWSQP